MKNYRFHLLVNCIGWIKTQNPYIATLYGFILQQTPKPPKETRKFVFNLIQFILSEIFFGFLGTNIALRSSI